MGNNNKKPLLEPLLSEDNTSVNEDIKLKEKKNCCFECCNICCDSCSGNDCVICCLSLSLILRPLS